MQTYLFFLDQDARVQIIADEPNNALLILASPRDYRGIEAVILAHRAALLPGLSDRLLDTGDVPSSSQIALTTKVKQQLTFAVNCSPIWNPPRCSSIL